MNFGVPLHFHLTLGGCGGVALRPDCGDHVRLSLKHVNIILVPFSFVVTLPFFVVVVFLFHHLIKM